MKNKKIIIGIIAVIIVAVSMFFLKDVTIERTVESENGVYVGETTLFDSLPNGTGIMDYSDGSTYSGEWLDGQREGYGEAGYFGKSSYIGNWEHDLYNGEGVFTDKFAKVYTGNFVDGELENGIIDDYVSAGYRGDVRFQREVENFESTIIGVNEVNSYEELIEEFSENVANGNLDFIFISNNFNTNFRELYNEYDDEYYTFIDDVDRRMFEKYSFIPNVRNFSTSYKEADELVVVKANLRDDIGEEKIIQIHDEVDRITDEIIDDDMSTFTKIQTLHDYLCKNVEYVTDNTYMHNSYGALIEHEGVCEGYVEAFSLLLSDVGISNYIVYGDDMDLDDKYNHVWNLVEFEDGFYHIDVTWDDYDDGNKIGYEYFGISDSEIEKDHTVYRNDLPDSGSKYNMFYDYYSRNGKSTYIYYSNATYYGQINRYGIENGYGVTRWFDGDKYSGNYVNGIRQGQGKFEFNNGDVYEGNFENDDIKGYGTYTWSTGQSRTQEW